MWSKRIWLGEWGQNKLKQDETNENGAFDYNDWQQESDYIGTQQKKRKWSWFFSDTISAQYDINTDVSTNDENNNNYAIDASNSIIVIKVLKIM
jgi:hypothetical protein